MGNPLDIFLFVTLELSSLVQFPSCLTQRNTGSPTATLGQQQKNKWTLKTRRRVGLLSPNSVWRHSGDDRVASEDVRIPSVCETPELFRGFKNVTGAPVPKKL